jgi:hypothetical protein
VWETATTAAVRRVAGVDLAMRQPRWLSRFTDAARQADRYRAGRVLVAGDAAHIQLPAGGPGMSAALQDVVNLGWKLAAQVKGWAPPGLLDTYHAERHPAVERMLSFVRAQGVLLSPGEHVTALRELVGELLTHEQTLRYVPAGRATRCGRSGAAAPARDHCRPHRGRSARLRPATTWPIGGAGQTVLIICAHGSTADIDQAIKRRPGKPVTNQERKLGQRPEFSAAWRRTRRRSGVLCQPQARRQPVPGDVPYERSPP